MKPLLNRRTRVSGLAAAALVVSLAAAPAAAQDARDQQPPAAVQPTAQVPLPSSVDLDAIRQAVAREPAIDLDNQRLRFYLEIVAKRPDFKDFLGSYDLMHGPVARAPITHQEFVQMVTPREVYSAGGIRPTEVLQMTLTGLLAKALVSKALKALGGASDEAELVAIRARIDRELRLLESRGR